ncbi:hypothetical protein [Pelagicoccus sp. SDUM812003]|uniref:hypothetical protein n=1 Tax=Pelagicoccus sp. SDUM812003 TaxID=3041267 RepID=UPI00280C91DD|nr:hypothetical protein [Pelagicoccus sp. SDUM812003]MDQ8203953.1 hypothetical protein [Pelagicoccus sp. SDUM812003]
MNIENTSPSFETPEPDACETLQQPAPDETERSRIWSKLPQLLRWIGGISLFGSAAAFLLGGWMDAEPLTRYYSFFGLTTVLSLAGLFCGLRLKEDKGARTFLALGTAFLPALFCQLGGLVYAKRIGHSSQFSEYFHLFQFDPISSPLLALTLAVALALLPLYAFLGFSSMARKDAKALTLTYILSNAVLLIPTRSDLAITSIGLALLTGLVSTDLRHFAKRPSLKNWDGRAMRTLLFAPFALLLLRNALLHDVSTSLASLLFASIGALFFVALPKCCQSAGLQRFYQHFSILPLFVAWMAFISSFEFNAHPIGISFYLTFGSIPFALILLALSKRAVDGGRSLRFLAAALAISSAVFQMSDLGGLAASALSLIVSIAAIVGSYFLREKGILYLGLIGTAVSLIFHLGFAIDLYQSKLWLSLAGTGVAVILAASYLERHWQRLLSQGKELRSSLQSWS